MQSFRSEIENPVVEQDIIDLANKIAEFKDGKVDEEKFRSLRLARGVYGQRQQGVQMIRIKLPFGRLSSEQLHRIADVSDEYSKGRLHITTRQDIQIHYVSLDRTPQLWADLEKDNITLREACGNVVRNVTANETAGIDKNEPFDVSPYADAMFKYFLRNPICQEMGRKFKISFSGNDLDEGLSYLHDIGFIAKEKDGVRGFKVLVGGGLGSQPRHGDVMYDFVETDQIVPIMEGILRVFDRHGERTRRAKARMKFLIKDIGYDAFVELVNGERKALAVHSFPIDTSEFDVEVVPNAIEVPAVAIADQATYDAWKAANVIEQKQAGLFAIGVRVPLGDFYTDKARLLADLVKKYAGNEIRLSLRQNILIKHVREDLLPFFFVELTKLGFVELGYNAAQDITACPGTDTCNLGIASSTGIAVELERIIKEEYPQYINNKDLTIKISGCMNACGQHNMAEIGFQGMSVKAKDGRVAPALQVLLGGGNLGDGNARFSDKVLKIPSKRGDDALRYLLNDFDQNKNEGERYVHYYERKGEKYFYDILHPLSDVSALKDEDFIDWGTSEDYVKAIGVGECAGVVIDLIATLLMDSKEKIENAEASLKDGKWSDSIYYAYTSMINTAKALLLAEEKKTNTHGGIVADFDTYFVETKLIELPTSFANFVYQINQNEPTEAFATKFIEDAKQLVEKVQAQRAEEVK